MKIGIRSHAMAASFRCHIICRVRSSVGIDATVCGLNILILCRVCVTIGVASTLNCVCTILLTLSLLLSVCVCVAYLFAFTFKPKR